MSDENPGRLAQAADVRLLPWILLTLAAEHSAAAVTGLMPHGAGGVCVAVDILFAAAVLAALLATAVLGATREPATVLTPAVLTAGVAGVVTLAGLASGVRAAQLGAPWTGADVVLAILAAAVFRRRVLVAAAAGLALAAWTGAVVVGAAVHGTSGPAVAWVLLAVTLAGTVAAAATFHHALGRLVDERETAVRTATQQAVTDPLTGVTNRRGLELMAIPMIEHARRQGEATHCLFIDLDSFRTVNETLGRASGDEALTAVCEALLASVRATDVVGRWAGDQFVILGPGTGTSPLEMERRVRGHLTETPPVPAEVWDGRVSIGSATLVPWDEGNLDSLLHRAEEDMHLRRSLRRQSRGHSVAPPPVISGAPRGERRGDPPRTPPASPTVPGNTE